MFDHESGRHAGKTPRPGTADEGQQNGLGLVVAGMS